MAGIDHERLRKILVEDGLKTEEIYAQLKLENTFVEVRNDAADREL